MTPEQQLREVWKWSQKRQQSSPVLSPAQQAKSAAQAAIQRAQQANTAAGRTVPKPAVPTWNQSGSIKGQRIAQIASAERAVESGKQTSRDAKQAIADAIAAITAGQITATTPSPAPSYTVDDADELIQRSKALQQQSAATSTNADQAIADAYAAIEASQLNSSSGYNLPSHLQGGPLPVPPEPFVPRPLPDAMSMEQQEAYYGLSVPEQDAFDAFIAGIEANMDPSTTFSPPPAATATTAAPAAPAAPAPPVPWYDQTTPQSVVDAYDSPNALTGQMNPEEAAWLEMAQAQGVFGEGLGQVPFDQTVPTADWDPEMTYGQQLVDDPRLQMRTDLARSLLDQGYTVADIEQFLGMESLMTSEELGTTAGQMVDPSFAGVGSQQWFDYIEEPYQETAAWVDSPEFAKEYGAPAPAGAGPDPTGPMGGGDNGGGQGDFGGPGETPVDDPVNNFVSSQTEALNLIKDEFDAIEKAITAAKDASTEQLTGLQETTQTALNAIFKKQYGTLKDPITGELLEPGEMDRLLSTWKDEQSKSKAARATDKAIIGALAEAEGVASAVEFNAIDQLHGDQVDTMFQYVDSLWRIGKMSKDDRDAMLLNTIASYKADVINNAIQLIMGASIDRAGKELDVGQDALASRDVAEYLGADPNTIFAGMRGDIPIGEMAYQTSERLASEKFQEGESALDRAINQQRADTADAQLTESTRQFNNMSASDQANLLAAGVNMTEGTENYGRMVGWDPSTGLTPAQKLQSEQFGLGLLGQGIDTRQMVPNPWVPGEMMDNENYGRPWGWDSTTGLGTADQTAVDLAAEQYLDAQDAMELQTDLDWLKAGFDQDTGLKLEADENQRVPTAFTDEDFLTLGEGIGEFKQNPFPDTGGTWWMSPEEMDTYGSILESVVNSAVTGQQNEWTEADRAETQAEIAKAKEKVEAEEKRLAVWGDYPNPEGNPRLALDKLAPPTQKINLTEIVNNAMLEGEYIREGSITTQNPKGKSISLKDKSEDSVWLTVLADVAQFDLGTAIIWANITGIPVEGLQEWTTRQSGTELVAGKRLNNFIANPDGTYEWK
jgi:hypothetical protein